MMIAEAQVQTEHGSRYLAELCRRFQQRAEAKPELGVRVEWSHAQTRDTMRAFHRRMRH